jgi:subtilisin family serine protease
MAFSIRLTLRAFAAIAGVALSASVATGASLVDVSSLQVAQPVTSAATPGTIASGKAQVIVRLPDKPLAAMVGANAKRTGIAWTAAQQRAYVAQLAAKQDALKAQIAALGGTELARVSKAHVALVVEIDAKRLPELAKLPGVAKVRPVVDYELSLSETVPYIGAASLQSAGLDGTGITVAVLDSGIDYTHRNIDGDGTTASYEAAYGTATADSRNKTRDGLFPTAKVIEGFDFVGERWTGASGSPPLEPDPDPIDCSPTAIGCGGGHGTHVADIIAGHSLDGTHKGVAPGAKLLAAKVCSAVSTSCSGVALLQGVDFALDPNGDNDISDAADVINLSLGSSYGQREDDLSEALANGVRFGVVVVASAGNSGDRPYIAGSPSTTPEVISVAQTQTPSATGFPLLINSPASIAGSYPNTATLDWAPVGAGATGNVAFVGRGCPAAGATPADPYLDDPAGKIALIDRGVCGISLKVDRAAKAGAIGVLIGLVAPGDAVSFSFGGGDTFVPSIVITQPVSNLIKANIAAPVNVTFGPGASLPLVGSIVASSSRGPGYSYVQIKPDIGAPGASMSAEVGTGTGETPFGGTSGAAPMVSGAAALLLDQNPSLTPLEVKARLMNSADTNILKNPSLEPGVLAEITRIGGGEVRVDRAAALMTTMYDAADPANVGLSFGYNAATGAQALRKKVTVRNYAAGARTYSVAPSFRFANDAASGAISFVAPSTVTVPGNGSATFTMTLNLNANALPAWNINSGSQGGNGVPLRTLEYDGYVTLSDGIDTVHLPWHVLPHKAANTKAAKTSVALAGAASANVGVTNTGGAVTGLTDVFALTGTSARYPTSVLPQPGDNFAMIDLRAVGVRVVDAGGGTLALQVAMNTYGSRSHAVYPAEFDIYIDSNNDGENDFVIFNTENGAFASTGQTVVNVLNLHLAPGAPGRIVTRFFADADLNSANFIATALLSDLGLTAHTKFRMSVYAFDNYFTGAATDAIENMVHTLDTPKFGGSIVPGAVPINGSSTLTISNVAGGAAASPSQSGLLLMYRNAKPGAEADVITVTP